MKEEKFEFNYNVFDSIDELSEDKRWMLNEDREVTEEACRKCHQEIVLAIERRIPGCRFLGEEGEHGSEREEGGPDTAHRTQIKGIAMPQGCLFQLLDDKNH